MLSIRFAGLIFGAAALAACGGESRSQATASDSLISTSGVTFDQDVATLTVDESNPDRFAVHLASGDVAVATLDGSFRQFFRNECGEPTYRTSVLAYPVLV